jgi:hypothetical protein
LLSHILFPLDQVHRLRSETADLEGLGEIFDLVLGGQVVAEVAKRENALLGLGRIDEYRSFALLSQVLLFRRLSFERPLRCS